MMRPNRPIIALALIASLLVAAGAPASGALFSACAPLDQPAPQSSCGGGGVDAACCCAAAAAEAARAPASCDCELAPLPPAHERGTMPASFDLPAPRSAAYAACEECASAVLEPLSLHLPECDVGESPPPSRHRYALLSLLLI